MSNFEILAGLPPYGPLALPFPNDRRPAFRQGLVVRFRQTTGETWVGNFQPGFTSFDCALVHPDQRHVVVIARGAGYLIEPASRQLTSEFGGDVSYAEYLPKLNIVLIGDSVGFRSFCADGLGWSSGRISWDGIRRIAIEDDTLRGEAYSPIGDAWQEFELDLLTGRTTGASYPPDMDREPS